MFLKSLNAKRNSVLKLRQHKAICRSTWAGKYAMFGNLTQQNIYFPLESLKKSLTILSVTISRTKKQSSFFYFNADEGLRNTSLNGFALYQTANLPDSSMGSLSAAFLTWSDSPVSDDSSIFKSFPWINTPSAGRRSPVAETAELASVGAVVTFVKRKEFSWTKHHQLRRDVRSLGALF